MLKIWNKISKIGTSGIALESDRRNVIMSNRIVTIIFLLNFVLFFSNLLQSGWTFFTWAILLGNTLTYPTILLLNKFKLSSISRLVLSLMMSVYPFFSSLRSKLLDPSGVEEAMYFSPRLFIMLTSIIPLLLFSVKEWRLMVLGLAGSFIPLFFFDSIHNYFDVGYYQMGFQSNGYPSFVTISIISYLMFLSAGFFFRRMNEKYELENLSLIASLKKKNEEIELQTKEIKIMNKNLGDVLDRRTKRLLDQALKFQVFSFKNSHELRAPLTNVMTIINKLKTAEEEVERERLMELLDQSCKRLDEIVHEINEIVANESIESRSIRQQ